MPQRLAVTVLGLTWMAIGPTGAQQLPGAPQPATGAPVRADAAISGVVLDATTKQPIVDAVVQLAPSGPREYAEVTHRQFTDGRGRFAFTDLPGDADYTVTAQKSGYFDGAYGATGTIAAQRSPIRLTSGQWFASANVTLARPGSISGTVVDERGEPAIGVYVRALARVRVSGTDRLAAVQVTLTDDRGMYRVANLYPGRYVVMVPSVQASAPAAATAGVLSGMTAQADQTARAAGRTFSYAEPLIDVDAATRLVVRGYPVPPPPSDTALFTYPITFAGGTSLAQATTHTVEVGTDLLGVDVKLTPMPAVRVSGVVEGPPEARAGLTLRLLREDMEDIGLGGEVATALVAEDGSFVFANVPSGNYAIEAPVSINSYLMGAAGIFYAPRIPTPPGMSGISTMSGWVAGAPAGVGFSTSGLRRQAPYWARTSVSVGPRGESHVVVTLQPTLTMRGRLVAETDEAAPAIATPPRYVSLETATGSTTHGRAQSVYSRNVPAGEFAIEGIVPGLYLMRGDSGWLIKSFIVNGRDYTNTPIEIAPAGSYSDAVVTFTNAVPSITGTVRHADGSLAADSAVIVFPIEPAQWTNYGISPERIKVARASTAGSFRIRSIHAGDYYVVAVPAAIANSWREPDFFKRAAAVATRVTIAWGDQKTTDVRVSDIR